jgi:hypothetical protein
MTLARLADRPNGFLPQLLGRPELGIITDNDHFFDEAVARNPLIVARIELHSLYIFRVMVSFIPFQMRGPLSKVLRP